MAAVSITASAIVPSTGAEYIRAVAAVTITQGLGVYIDSVGQARLADANGTAVTAAASGISVSSVLAGQVVTIQTGGNLAMGAVLVAGLPYFVGPTAGEIVPVADIGASAWTTLLGVATSTSNLKLNVWASGAQSAA